MNEGELNTDMEIQDVPFWNKNAHGIYTAPSEQGLHFVPRGRYTLGEHTLESFVRDGLAITIFTPEGAELFAKIAYEGKRGLAISGVNVDKINQPEKTDLLLSEKMNPKKHTFKSLLHMEGEWETESWEGYALAVRKG